MASDFLLEIDGVKGESLDETYPGSIEVSSFSWGISNAGSFATGTGGGAGKSSFQDLHISAAVSKASPTIAQFSATGKACATAKLHVSKQGGEQEEFYTIELTDVLISSYQSGGSEGSNAVPTDQFSLNFAKIAYSYCPQKADGSLDAAQKMTYDQKKATK